MAERNNRKLIDKVKSMINSANMLYGYGRESLYHSVKLLNYTMSSAVKNISPQESLLESTPNNSRMSIFGCAVYVHTDRETHASKLAYHVQLEIYLATTCASYRVCLMSTRSVVQSKDIFFDEEKLPNTITKRPKYRTTMKTFIGSMVKQEKNQIRRQTRLTNLFLEKMLHKKALYQV